jgi:histidinol dehydrogenase
MYRKVLFTPQNKKKVYSIIDRMNHIDAKVPESVVSIVDDVEKNGDRAVRKYTKMFDKVTVNKLRVSPEDIKKAYLSVDERLFRSLNTAAGNIGRFHIMQKNNLKGYTFRNTGYKITQKYLPLDSVGIYIPGGQAPLVSTVLMAGIPAIIAGVKRIVLISPPRCAGEINPYVLVAADLIGIKEIYRVGGAQGIAALAFGTKTMPKVDKIVGPGNIYSTMAKKYLFGKVGIDSINGPSEITVIADSSANVQYICYDLMAQAEHINGHAMLITNSAAVADKAGEILRGVDYDITAIVVKNMKEAVELTNYKAPEHLLVCVKDPEKIVNAVTNAPAIFVGNYSPVAFGDYMAGSNHILPTNGTAKFFSGLSVFDFLKHTHIVEGSRQAMEKFGPQAEMLAEIETLDAHKRSMSARREI